MFTALERDLRKFASPEKAQSSSWFFKTGKGQYGYGDEFIGVTVPEQRIVAKRYRDISFSDLEKLLTSPIHEYRLTALFILVDQFTRGSEIFRKTIFDFYLSHTRYVNNWDLVDSSAPYIVGECLVSRDRKILYRLALSSLLWERRIAVLATFAFIKRNDFKDSLAIAELLLSDTHDLIHKAVGWMLREVGKRDLAVEKAFLGQYAKIMPRTMLRYAIETFDREARAFYLGI